jgi:NADH:ubiquinone oxidoreductase subunit D
VDQRGLLLDNDVVLARCRGLSPVTPEQAIDWGLTGPMLRATGFKYDIRKNEPYCIYDRFDFEIPTGVQGDIYDRLTVRVAEMEQSVHVIIVPAIN